jgi:hypothetical protein
MRTFWGSRLVAESPRHFPIDGVPCTGNMATAAPVDAAIYSDPGDKTICPMLRFEHCMFRVRICYA